MNNLIRVFVGYEAVQNIGFLVLVHSIFARCSRPVQVTKLDRYQIERVCQIPKKGAHEFTFSRFMIPYLCNYEGWAIYIDCDQMLVDDIAKLWDMQRDGVSVFHADHKGERQQKNKCSVMLMNCADGKILTPEYVNSSSWSHLHGLEWAKKTETFPIRWNYLVSQYPEIPVEQVSLLHFTDGGPWDQKKPHQVKDFRSVWLNEYDEVMRHKIMR